MLLYDRFATVLYSLAIKILRDNHEAEEVLQEAMTCLWEKAPSYDHSAGKPLSWAVAITRNKAIDLHVERMALHQISRARIAPQRFRNFLARAGKLALG